MRDRRAERRGKHLLHDSSDTRSVMMIVISLDQIILMSAD